MLPQALLKYIRDGGAVRVDTADAYAGRCGGLTKSDNDSGATFCRRAAGMYTASPWKGRCHQHPDLNDGGLPPWMGDLSDQAKDMISGRHPDAGAVRALVPRPSRSIHQMLLDWLPEDEANFYQAVPPKAEERLDLMIRLLLVGTYRVQQWLRKRQAQYAEEEREMPMEAQALAERLISENAKQIARLQDAASKHREAEKGAEVDDRLLAMLHGLSDEQFRRLSSDPRQMSEHMGSIMALPPAAQQN